MTRVAASSPADVQALARLFEVRLDAARLTPVAAALRQLLRGMAAMDRLELSEHEPSARFDPSWE